MKNFFDAQDQARRLTSQLIFLFGASIICTILGLYISFLIIEYAVSGYVGSLWRPAWLLGTSVTVAVVVSYGTLSKTQTLRQGGRVIAESLGGRLVGQETSDPQARELLNVVEEMAIASGTAVPSVYLLPETSINAFAAGFTPNDAVIGVTQGCVDRLNRDQLQGVIGHEFSHIVNGDMALNLKLIGLVHGLLLIFMTGYHLLRHSNRNKGAILGTAIACMSVGSIGWAFGQLIKSAVSRQREFLADASAVQFTRNPQGLADALRQIAQTSHLRPLSSPHAEAASHLFFNEISLSRQLFAPLSTHPPLAERIRRLEGVAASKLSSATTAADPTAAPGHPSISALAKDLPSQSVTAPILTETAPAPLLTSPQLTPSQLTLDMLPAEVLANIGTVSPAHLKQAKSILSHLPMGLVAAARSQPGAVAVVYGLLLSELPEVRSQQKQTVANSSKTVHDLLVQLEPLFSEVKARSRLPLVELCIPSLKSLKPAIAGHFFNQVKALVQADGKLFLNEYALQSLLQYRLEPHFRTAPPPSASHTELAEVWAECVIILTALAKAGHTETQQANYAFRNGLSHLPGSAKQTIPNTLPACSLHDVSRALKVLRLTAPKLKQAIADACAHTVLTDARTTDPEAELLRAILITLGCPVPPFLNIVS
jgi:Zn-dependent protease with chaperone function